MLAPQILFRFIEVMQEQILCPHFKEIDNKMHVDWRDIEIFTLEIIMSCMTSCGNYPFSESMLSRHSIYHS